MKYTVVIERVEHYKCYAEVDAETPREAERIAQERDNADEYVNEWNEFQPEVETTYWATTELGGE